MMSADRPPAFGPEGQQMAAIVLQLLAVQVLIISHGIRDRPGYASGVPEVWQAWNAGKGKPDDVELRARQTHLLVDAGEFHEAVRVAGNEGRPGFSQAAGSSPGVAAGPHRR